MKTLVFIFAGLLSISPIIWMYQNHRENLASIKVHAEHTTDDPTAYISRGISYYWLGQCQKAMSDFQYAFSILPKDQYMADLLSTTTLQGFDDVMNNAAPLLKNGGCVDVVD